RDTLYRCPAERRRWDWHYLRRLCQLEVKKLEGHRTNVASLAYSPDGGSVVTGDKGGTVIIWDAESGKDRGRWQAPTGPVTSLCFLEGGRVVSAGQDFNVRIWDTFRGQELLKPLLGAGNFVAASRSGNRLAIIWDFHELAVWERQDQGGALGYRKRAPL